MSGGGEYDDDTDTPPQASSTHTPTIRSTPPPVRTYTDTHVDDHTVSDSYVCGNNIIADTVSHVHMHAHDAAAHPLIHNIPSIMHDNSDVLNDNNDGPLFDSYMCTTHPDGQPLSCTLSAEEKLLNAHAVGYHPPHLARARYPGAHYMTELAQFSTPSCAGHHYCLVCVDVFTGFIVLKALIDKKASTVARALWEIFSVIGSPQILQSNGGSEFMNAVLATLTHLLGVPQRFISAYNPRSNGKVERSIRTIKTTIMKLLHDASIDWHLHLSFVQYAYNDKVQSLIGSTPFSLRYARNTNTVNSATRTDSNGNNDNDAA